MAMIELASLSESKGTRPPMKPPAAANDYRCNLPADGGLDLFQLTDGVAVFRKRYFGEIHRFNQFAGFPIRWGGKFQTIRDAVHFELEQETMIDDVPNPIGTK